MHIMSSILPSSFNFALQSKDSKIQKLPVDDTIKQRLKRRIDDIHLDPRVITSTATTNNHYSHHHNHNNHNHHRILRNRLNFIRQKKLRNNYDSNQIIGTKLSLNKLIETLDETSVKKLVLSLVDRKPELIPELTEMSPSLTTEMALNKLNENLNSIIDNLPYKVDPSSDYSYLRVKSFVNEFYSNLSDFILNFLPPVETDLSIVISFLFKFLSKIYSKMPTFNTIEFNYMNSVTIEKLNSILSNNIISLLNEKSQNIMIAINNNWLDMIKEINQILDNKFNDIEELLTLEINNYNNCDGSLENRLASIMAGNDVRSLLSSSINNNSSPSSDSNTGLGSNHFASSSSSSSSSPFSSSSSSGLRGSHNEIGNHVSDWL